MRLGVDLKKCWKAGNRITIHGGSSTVDILIGLHDYGKGTDLASLTVSADFEIDGCICHFRPTLKLVST